ncbi:MAG TPA: AMP-binding protein [Stellaceae bacterium]|nr:AMP-binding protein [Stellaceae bacterium]
MNIAAWLEKNARSHGDRPAISVGGAARLGFAEWALRVRRMAGHLRGRFSCAPGARVAIAMTNCPEFLEAQFAIWHAGLVAVPINAKLHRNEFAYILEHCGARLVFASPDLEATIGPLAGTIAGLEVIVAGSPEWQRLFLGEGTELVHRSGDDPAWLFYTSGTTGRPKGATLTHRNLLVAALSYFADIDWVAPTDAILHAAPLSHGSGLYGLPHIARAANSVIPESGHFDPAEIAELLPRWQGVSFFAAPTMVTRLVANGAFAAADHRSLKTIVYGGGPMYVADLERALDLLGPRLSQIYGQGEAPMTITGLSKAHHAAREHPRWRERLGSTGIARTDVEVRVVDAEDRDVPLGESGEVLARGDVVMAGYWDDPEATARALRGGWLHTGDIGAFDEDGFLTLKDRAKDLIISGGANIYPREVEEVLLRHPAVAEASVVGRPHPDWGEEVVAFIVARGAPPAEAELDRLCLSEIARFKRPKAYRFVAALPKNNYGKVLKTELRKLVEEEPGRR